MALYRALCATCGVAAARLGRTEAEALKKPCTCGGELRRAATGPSVQTMETLDNGIMPRKVVRFARAEQMYRERSEKADPLAGGGIDLPKIDK